MILTVIENIIITLTWSKMVQNSAHFQLYCILSQIFYWIVGSQSKVIKKINYLAKCGYYPERMAIVGFSVTEIKHEVELHISLRPTMYFCTLKILNTYILHLFIEYILPI